MSRRIATFIRILLVTAALGAARADSVIGEDAKYQKTFDAAIDKALTYLAQKQLPDGSYPGGMPKNTAVASLSVMAFLAKGYTPGNGPYGETINRSIDFVIGQQGTDGAIIGPGGGQMYSHNISTLMLSEISGMVDPERQKRVDRALSRALKVILAAQEVKKSERDQGGWRYWPGANDSDLSHSGWALMALRSARNNGAPVPKDAIDRAVKYVMRCRSQNGGFGYQGGGHSLACTGVGLLCLELSGQHRTEVTLKAGALIAKEFGKDMRNHVYYTYYYNSQGMFQLGGEEWDKFAPVLYETVLKGQQPDGSWAGVGQEANAGPSYCTSMAVLALSVTYRQLPIYQR